MKNSRWVLLCMLLACLPLMLALRLNIPGPIGPQGPSGEGSQNTGSWRLVSETRTMPTVVDDIVELGNFQIGSNRGGAVFRMTLSTSASPRASKYYIASYRYQQSSTWLKHRPLFVSNDNPTAHDYQLETRLVNQTLNLRVRNLSGSIASVLQFVLEMNKTDATAWNSTSVTSSEAAPTAFQTNTMIVILNYGAGPPASARCDHDTERGRKYIDTTNNREYTCNGATRGWDYITLTD